MILTGAYVCVLFSRKRCLKLGKIRCKKTNKNEDRLFKQLRQY